MIDVERLAEGASALGLSLSPRQLEQFDAYASLLAEWNEKMNLTRVPPEEFVPLHFLDSLTVLSAVPVGPGNRLIDVGTGAGFPGVPLKIAIPGLEVTLLDATRKRLDFLSAVIEELGLEDIRVLHARAEDAGKGKHRGAYTLVTARAVARLGQLAEWLLPFARVGGKVVSMKSATVDDELAEAMPVIESLGGRLDAAKRVRVPTTEIDRTLVVIGKSAEARPTNPRRPTRPPKRRRE